MSQWEKVVQVIPEQQINEIYKSNSFPLEARHFLARWIEEQPWRDIDVHNPEHEETAKRLRDQLVGVLKTRAEEMVSDDLFLSKLKLKETARKFEEMYKNDPMPLVSLVRRNLHREITLMLELENSGNQSQQAVMARHMKQQFEYLAARTQQTDNDSNVLQQKQESFVIKYQQSATVNNQIEQVTRNPNQLPNHQATLQNLTRQKQQLERELTQKAAELLKLRLDLSESHRETIASLSTLQHHIMDQKVISWKREQQLAGNGDQFENNLDELQMWCMRLADLIWSNRHQLRKVELLRTQLPINIPPNKQDLLPELNKSITGLLSGLVTNTFIIEKQPPQVLKKDSRFQATVRLLVGSKFHVHINPPTVKASIISEDQARSLLTNDRTSTGDPTCGNILNSVGTMEFNQSNDQLSVTFRNMALKSIKRAEKKGNETVTEEKFCILFESQFTAGDGELVFQVWTLSVPVVVTVHGNQECNALATVLWDNAFAAQGRAPFQVPDKVFWPQLAQVLHTKFLSQCHRGLSKDNLDYLASKLFGLQDDYTNQYVTWVQFNREALPNRNFTFWEWFYALLKLTKDWLQGPWKEGHIIGFLSKERSHQNLKSCCPGTFLLRFSDSELGGITIAWTHEPKPGEKNVLNLAPFTDKDFKIRLLGDHVKDLGQLKVLYPNIPKNIAFSQFWTATADLAPKMGGYVTREINTVIPGIASSVMDTAQPMNEDNPSTPLPIQSPFSPESTMSVNQGNFDNDYNFPNTLSASIGDYDVDDMVPNNGIGCTDMDDLLATYEPTTDMQTLQSL